MGFLPHSPTVATLITPPPQNTIFSLPTSISSSSPFTQPFSPHGTSPSTTLLSSLHHHHLHIRLRLLLYPSLLYHPKQSYGCGRLFPDSPSTPNLNTITDLVIISQTCNISIPTATNPPTYTPLSHHNSYLGHVNKLLLHQKTSSFPTQSTPPPTSITVNFLQILPLHKPRPTLPQPTPSHFPTIDRCLFLYKPFSSKLKDHHLQSKKHWFHHSRPSKHHYSE